MCPPPHFATLGSVFGLIHLFTDDCCWLHGNVIARGGVTTSEKKKREGYILVVVFDQGQVERSCVCVPMIRLSPGETSPSERAGMSILSSCYKTDWPSAIEGGGGVSLGQYVQKRET